MGAGALPLARPVPVFGQEILRAEDTVELEHEDRVWRLNRAIDQLGIQPRPRFTVTRVPRNRMPANFQVEVPVLRVAFSERTFFDTAQSNILPSGLDAISAIAASARGEAPDVAIFVAGHTDSRGGEEYNQNLSIRRANAVSDAMMDFGVGDVALWRVGFGEAAPLYANDTDEHMAFNRRVEFLFGARVEPVVDVLTRQREDQVCIASSESQSRRCVAELPQRETFVATQRTSRAIGVGGDGRSAQAARARPGSAAQSDGHAGRSASVAPGSQRSATVAASRSLSIPLRRPRAIAAPRR